MTTRVKRFDYSGMSEVVRTPQGYLRAPAFATRVGVFKYRKPDGSVLRELRPPEEVFKADSMVSLEGVPVTLEHPSVMLDSENTKGFMVGFTGSVEKRDTFLATSVTITDRDAIEKVASGKKEVSCGYHADLDPTPGVWQGEHYDVVQRNIVYNHLAVVDKGRAGPEVRIRLDSEDAILVDGEDQQKPEEKKSMAKIKIDEMEFECSQELADAWGKMMGAKKDAEDKATSEVAEAQKKFDELQGKFDAQKDELEKAKADLEAAKTERNDTAEIEKIVNERVQVRSKLVATAQKVLAKDTKFDEMTDRQVKEAVILAVSPKAELKDKSDEYVAARFDSAVESLDDTKITQIGVVKADGGKNEGEPNAEEARQKAMERSKSAWKEPLSATKK